MSGTDRAELHAAATKVLEFLFHADDDGVDEYSPLVSVAAALQGQEPGSFAQGPESGGSDGDSRHKMGFGNISAGTLRRAVDS